MWVVTRTRINVFLALLSAIAATMITMYYKDKYDEILNPHKYIQPCDKIKIEFVTQSLKGLDLNEDGSIDVEECMFARSHYLSWWEHQLLSSCRQIVLRCDMDGDGRIDKSDMLHPDNICFKNCDNMANLLHMTKRLIKRYGSLAQKS